MPLLPQPPLPSALDEDEDFCELRADLFAELGVEVGQRAAAAAAAAAATPATLPPGAKRARTPVQRFDPAIAERGGGGWGPYDLKRVGQRHGRTHRQAYAYKDLLAEAQQLRKQMGSISRLVAAKDRSFNAVMERVAAIMLQAALADEDCGSGEEAGSEAPPPAATPSYEAAATTAPSGGDELRAEPRARAPSCEGEPAVYCSSCEAESATRAPSSEAEPAARESHPSFSVVHAGTTYTAELLQGELHLSRPQDGQLGRILPLEHVLGVSRGSVAQTPSCILMLSSDKEPLELCFPAATPFAAIMKQHAKARDNFVEVLEAACASARASSPAPTATQPTPAAEAVPSMAEAPTSAPPTAAARGIETARMRKGRELRELLQQVVKLRSAHKMKESDLLLEAAAAADDSSVGEALVKKRAQQLRGELFTFGGLELTRAILAQFLSLPEVKLLLPEATRQAQQEAADSKTAIALLEAASKFLHEVLKSKGRRKNEFNI